MTPRVGLNVHPDEHFRALLPLLLGDDAVEAIEWSFELGSAPWLEPLVDLFAAHGALTTHLVQFPLNGHAGKLEALLARVRAECTKRPPRFVTAHHGVIAARGFTAMAPVPVVPSAGAAREAAERLARLREAAGCPVGVENLGIAFSADDVRRQAEMMHAILATDPEHFMLLDVHNLHCQAENYGFSAHEILALYPLDRVRELHVSGGSWWEGESAEPAVATRLEPAETRSARFRRDTHDQAVPDGVFQLLSAALAHTPHVELVCFERMGGTMPSAADREEVRADYRRTVETVRAARPNAGEPHAAGRARGEPVSLVPVQPRSLPNRPRADVRELETALVAALCDAASADAVRTRVSTQHPEYAAWLAEIDERALQVAMTFERCWARRS